MVSWTQGSMRHNFFRTNGTHNAFSDQPRLDAMYVISVLTELEFSLNAAAKATQQGKFATSHARHCRSLQQELQKICDRVTDRRLNEALATISAVRFSLANAPSFGDAAKKLSKLSWDFSLLSLIHI